MGINLIEFRMVDFGYAHPEGPTRAVDVLSGVDLRVAQGEYVALLGGRGSGKTTFLKLCNGLLMPDRGEVSFRGTDSRNVARLMEVRRGAAMVFQDPDSQIVGTTVAEDVAFGPENLGLPTQVVRERVQDALQALSLSEQAGHPVHLLTAWQKLKLAIAGAVAMQPDCLLVDDASAELDGEEKKLLRQLLRSLNKQRGIAVLHATGDLDDATAADRTVLLNEARIVSLDATTTRPLPRPDGIEAAAHEPSRVAESAKRDGARGGKGAGWQTMLAGRYLPGTSLLHRCDPRTKLALALLVMAAAFALTTPAALALLLAVTLALTRACGRPLRHSLASLRPILYLALVAAAVNLAGAGGDPLADHGALSHVSRQGAALSALMVLRLLLMAATASLLTCTTTPSSLGDGVEKMLRPLGLAGLPTSQLAAMLQVSLRLLPVIVDEAAKLIQERSGQGEGGQGSLAQRIARLPAILVPLFGKVARRGEAMAEAMEARCYRGPVGRSRMNPLSFSGADLAGAILLLVVLLAAAGIEYLQR